LLGRRCVPQQFIKALGSPPLFELGPGLDPKLEIPKILFGTVVFVFIW
jgi:hypothetical protein